ncbi:MAG: hypothetical protein VYA30_04175 [Myxococcota bacterium]|nr:hypothetical protein [Myxococcota bacterium]
MGRAIFASLFVLSIFSIANADTSAGADSQPKSGVSTILGELDWGATKQQVLEDAAKRLDEEWRGQVKRLDSFHLDKLRKSKRDELQRIRDSYRSFSAGTTGLESSIVGGEIVAGENEALLEQTVNNQARYYFFRDGKLWKIAVVFDASSAKGFTDFTGILDGSFGRKGKPAKNIRGGKAHRWTDQMTLATGIDLVEFYHAYLVLFIQRGEGEILQAARLSRQATKPPTVQSALVDDLLSGPDEADEEEENIVDALTGSKHEVNLNRARLFEQPAMPQFESTGADSNKHRRGKKKNKKKK